MLNVNFTYFLICYASHSVVEKIYARYCTVWLLQMDFVYEYIDVEKKKHKCGSRLSIEIEIMTI
jgi:hypothetical protein